MPWQRIVGSFPLGQLWTYGGLKPHRRVRDLSATDVAEFLSAYPNARLVVAKVGCDLRWYAAGNFGFWRNVVQSRTACCESAVSHETGYIASLWESDTPGEIIILFEEIESGE